MSFDRYGRDDEYEPEMYGDDLLVEDHHFESRDEFGFEEKRAEAASQLNIRPLEVPGLDSRVKIKLLVASDNSIVIVSDTNNIYRWRFNDDNVKKYEVPDRVEETGNAGILNLPGAILGTLGGMIKKIGEDKSTAEIQIERVFMDPRGYHLLLASDTGDCCYLSLRGESIKYLTRLRGIRITSAAWDETCNEENTREVLLGSEGQIISFKIEPKGDELVEGVAKQLLKLPTESPIVNLESVIITRDSSRFCIVLATTTSSIYTFTGSASYDILFEKYAKPENQQQLRNARIPFTKGSKALIHVNYSQPENKPQSFLWTNGHNLAFFKFPETGKLDNSFMKEPNILKYAKKTDLDEKRQALVQEMPKGVCLSDYHYFLLHEDGFTVLSRITEQVVTYFGLASSGPMLGLSYDKRSKRLYIYSARYIGELQLEEEDKDMWRVYLDKKLYKEAYEICLKYGNPEADNLAGLYADDLFAQKRFDEAAKQYALTSKTFEDITLKFISAGQEEALITYLENFVRKLNPSEQKTQRVLLLSWLTELNIYRINKYEKLMEFQDKAHEMRMKFEQYSNHFTAFLKEYIGSFEESIIYQILQSHGRLKDWVFFANMKEHYEMLITNYIHEELYREAIEKIKYITNENSKLEIIYRYCHLFMRYEPELTIAMLERNVKTFDPAKLVPGLMNIPKNKRETAIKFLLDTKEKVDIKDKSINNIIIFFLTEIGDNNRLLEFLKVQEEELNRNKQVNFDLDFALGLLKETKLIKPQVKIYSMMGLYNEAVSLALESDFELAKECANKPESLDLKKKLWLQIAVHKLNTSEDIQSVLQITEDTNNLVKIEDILPYLNENIKIEHFKDKICESLKSYNEEITGLKRDMEGYSANAENLKQELRLIKTKYVELEADHKCEECLRLLTLEEFYVFPCVHCFHKDCLLKKVKEGTFDKATLSEIDRLNERMSILYKKANLESLAKKQSNVTQATNATSTTASFISGIADFFGRKESVSNEKIQLLSPQEERELRDLKEKFDARVANDCPLCGRAIIDAIYQPFDPDKHDRKSWEI